MKDLTRGYPAKVILMFSIPIICGYIFQQLYSFADGKIVSNYVGTMAFAAVGATNVISNTIIGFMNGLTQGFAIPISNCFGAKDFTKMRKYIAGTIKLTLMIALVLTVISLIFIEDILRILKTPNEIMPYATSYVKIILAGIIFSAIYNMCANVLRAVGDSKTPLYCLMAAVVINIGLDLLFVRVFDKGIEGAAIATIISQAISGLSCVAYICIRFKDILPTAGEWKLDEGQYNNLITAGLSMGLMSCIVNIGTVVLQGGINSLGTAYVSAHTAGRRVFDILTVSLFAIGNSMTTYAGQNIGAGRSDRVRQGVRHAVVIVSVLATILMCICFLFARPVFVWLASTSDETIINAAVLYSRISISFFYFLGPLFIIRCTLQGVGRKIIPVFSSFVEMVIKILSAKFLVPIFAYTGVAFTEPISWVVMDVVLVIAYLRWRKEIANDVKIDG